ncbi:zf-HC2 domain-containing protein [bacterium]|nr:zf-HC2 domain-containing protein [bacterium]
MFCFRYRKLINQEMDGVLPARQTRPLEDHVAGCAACRSYREELEAGRRLLRATATEPSEAFEWTLHLKLNRALQGAAAEAAVPWVQTPANPLRWLRSFALSSAAGVALAAVLAIWVLPLQPGSSPAPGEMRLTESTAGYETSPVATSAGDSDRQPLTPRYLPLFSGPASAGRPVSGGRHSQPNLLDSSGWVPDTWRGTGDPESGDLAALREENGRLRFMLKKLYKENTSLKSLLAGTGIDYLENEGDGENR